MKAAASAYHDAAVEKSPIPGQKKCHTVQLLFTCKPLKTKETVHDKVTQLSHCAASPKSSRRR
jgi:hypothetical protein